MRQLDWPPALDARDVDDTVLSNNKGNLLPRNWPKPYYPIRSTDTNGMGTAKKSDHSIIQSHIIEDWSMSWNGRWKPLDDISFVKIPAARAAIIRLVAN